MGYTNAGKSTLLNCLTDAGVLSEDKLFATLDPTTRKLMLPDGEYVLLTDTVGLIRKLPHHLVEAFHSTLEEAALADVLLLLCDATDPDCEEEIEVTRETLRSLGAEDKPTLLVYNKCDAVEGRDLFATEREDAVFISAKTEKGVGKLLSRLAQIIRDRKREYTLRFTYDKSGELNGVYQAGTVENVEYLPEYIEVQAVLDKKGWGRYRDYLYPPYKAPYED